MNIDRELRGYLIRIATGFVATISVFTIYTLLSIYYLSTPRDDLYLAVSPTKGVLDYDMFDKNIEDIIAPLLRADVIFLGTSRSQFAFDQELLTSFFGEFKLKHFMLGFGNGRSFFPLFLMNKYKLKPRLIIATADDMFFSPIASEYTENTIKRNYLASIARTYHSRFLISQRVIMAKYLDVFKFNNRMNTNQKENLFIFRSKIQGAYELYGLANGSWILNPSTKKPRSVTPGNDGCEVDQAFLDTAIRFRDNEGLNNTNIALITVPYPGYCSGRARIIANYLGVPYLEPISDKLTTFDSSHLEKASATKFTFQFISVLRNHQEVMGILSGNKSTR
ncbi:MAG: hypothetical protein V1797_09100 [Pseudomonadota bacterium]